MKFRGIIITAVVIALAVVVSALLYATPQMPGSSKYSNLSPEGQKYMAIIEPIIAEHLDEITKAYGLNKKYTDFRFTDTTETPATNNYLWNMYTFIQLNDGRRIYLQASINSDARGNLLMIYTSINIKQYI